MALVTLNAAQALNSGAELWILSDAKDSGVLQKLDWYLNFQMTRAQNRKRTELPSQLKFILKECDISILESPMTDENHLMIAGQDLLPSQWVIQVAGYDQLSDWIKKISKIWISLKNPRMRVFLPKSIVPSQFQAEWQIEQPHPDLELVVEN